MANWEQGWGSGVRNSSRYPVAFFISFSLFSGGRWGDGRMRWRSDIISAFYLPTTLPLFPSGAPGCIALMNQLSLGLLRVGTMAGVRARNNGFRYRRGFICDTNHQTSLLRFFFSLSVISTETYNPGIYSLDHSFRTSVLLHHCTVYGSSDFCCVQGKQPDKRVHNNNRTGTPLSICPTRIIKTSLIEALVSEC